jgi:hypothetical protein
MRDARSLPSCKRQRFFQNSGRLSRRTILQRPRRSPAKTGGARVDHLCPPPLPQQQGEPAQSPEQNGGAQHVSPEGLQHPDEQGSPQEPPLVPGSPLQNGFFVPVVLETHPNPDGHSASLPGALQDR